ncbi:MAG: glycosyltransferase family 2 protein [Deltaproteobacteria bacterium]|nr:glycosyltransferase family 2 protein [Deltaproteobacteria bacterium]
MGQVSIVIPAYNESGIVGNTVESVREVFRDSGHEFEVIVVDDGSTDQTGREAEDAGALVIHHPKNIGYGNAILTGVKHARHPLVAITDADGTYPVSELPAMVSETEERGLDMLAGARKGKHYRGTAFKSGARAVLKYMAEFTAGRKIPDVNSGLRVMRRDMVLEYGPLLCGGFSFTTTITAVAMLDRRFVEYREIEYKARHGKSKVSYLRDALRVTRLLATVLLLFHPMKLYLLLAAGVSATGILAVIAHVALDVSGVTVSIFLATGLAAAFLIAMGLLAEQRRVMAETERAGSFRTKNR